MAQPTDIEQKLNPKKFKKDEEWEFEVVEPSGNVISTARVIFKDGALDNFVIDNGLSPKDRLKVSNLILTQIQEIKNGNRPEIPTNA